MVHSKFRQFLSDIFTFATHRPRHVVYAHMDFTDPGDFQAACRAVRDRHDAEARRRYRAPDID
jgi:hypothetical protein